MKPFLAFGSITAMALSAALSALPAPAAGPVQFRAHDIETSFPDGYAVTAADVNRDGRPDVIPTSYPAGSEAAWYENPGDTGTWRRHVIARGLRAMVNQALEDIDGDGTPEIAIQSEFAMQAAKSEGLVWIARAQGDPREPWKLDKIDTVPTSHRVVWADLDGDGRRELVNAPLVGAKSVAPAYDQDKASVYWYDTTSWTRHTIADDLGGIVHGLKTVDWDADKREEILVSSFEGIFLFKANGSGDKLTFRKTLLTDAHSNDKAPRLGSSDAGAGSQDGRQFLASIEPWHGNEVVVYNDVAGAWQRRVIFDKLSAGHGVVVVDLNGDGRSDVVANDNGQVSARRPTATPGVHVFYAPDDPAKGEWTYQRIDDKSAMNGCASADINRDKRVDLVCTGAGGVVRWYENLGR